jgi:hypothetical protein
VASLLEPLTPNQQSLVDAVAEAISLDGEWPIFDYLEGTFDNEGADAGATLASFSRVGRWNYGAVSWNGMGQMPKPTLETEIELTVVGMHHSRVLQPLVGVFFEVLELMVD